jgi:hypothetical protein
MEPSTAMWISRVGLLLEMFMFGFLLQLIVTF